MQSKLLKETKTLEEADYATPVEVIDNLFKKCQKSILRVKSIKGKQGTAAFYTVETSQNSHYCLISALHIFNSTNIEEITRAEFQFDKQMPFRFRREWILSVVASSELDAVVVEITKDKANDLCNNGTNFFFIHIPHVGDKVPCWP